MSHLQRSAMSARLAKLPYIPTVAPPYDDEDDVEEREEAMSGLGHLPALSNQPVNRTPNNVPLRSINTPDLKDYTPLSAASCFAQAMTVSVDNVSLDFRAYYTPPVSAIQGDPASVMLCHHGAGYSGLSFACFAREVTKISKGECGILAFDARRHGKTLPSGNAMDGDLSIETLVNDMLNLIITLFPDAQQAPSLLLVGHSMGGAVCVRLCPLLLERQYRLAGTVVLDVVEGSALEALPHMMHLLNTRPESFDSVESAVKWHLDTQTIRNLYSARTSIPAILAKQDDQTTNSRYIWRTPLRSTAPYWEGWFKGLSSRFLATSSARLLVLAGTDRLNKELMIGQMQGKFQMEVVAGVGHMLHEDDPGRLAEILVDFWKRNERVVAIGVKKVGER